MLSALLHTHCSFRHFLSHLRSAPTESSKRAAVTAELVRIRALFLESGSLNNYETRSVLISLIYIATLSYDLGQTGAFEALGALTSSCLLTRLWAHQTVACLFANNTDIVNFIKPCLQDSLKSSERHEVAAALNTAACMPSINDPAPLILLMEKLANPSNDSTPQIRKRAFLALAKYVKIHPERFPSEIWASRLTQSLKTEVDGNCLMALCTLIECCLPSQQCIAEWESVLPVAIRRLTPLRRAPIEEVGVYHGVPNPWLQIRLMRLLKFFSAARQTNCLRDLERFLISVLSASGKTSMKKCAPAHADQAILLEAVSLIAHFRTVVSLECAQLAVAIIASLLSDASASPISQYVAVRGMRFLASLSLTPDMINNYRLSIAPLLETADSFMLEEICRLLLALANDDNWALIIDDLTEALKRRIFCTPVAFDLARQTATLACNFAPTSSQLTSVLFKLVSLPDLEDIWEELIVLLTQSKTLERNGGVQKNATAEAYRVLSRRPRSEAVRKFCLYLLGEFGYLLVSDKICRNSELIDLTSKFASQKQPAVAAIAISSIAKLTNAACVSADTKKGLAFLKSASLVEDLEVQTRASELFLTLKQKVNFADTVLSLMPPYGSSETSETIEHSQGSRAVKKVTSDSSDNESQLSLPSSSTTEEADSTLAASSFEESRDASIAKTDLKGLWHVGCLSEEGLICETERLRITFIRRIKASMAKMSIRIENVSADRIGLTWSREETDDALQVEEANAQPQPLSLSAGLSTMIDLRVIQMSLAIAPCLFRIGLSVGLEPPTTFTIPIPLSALSFMHPIKTSLQALRDQWEKMAESGGSSREGFVKETFSGDRGNIGKWLERFLHMQIFEMEEKSASPSPSKEIVVHQEEPCHASAQPSNRQSQKSGPYSGISLPPSEGSTPHIPPAKLFSRAKRSETRERLRKMTKTFWIDAIRGIFVTAFLDGDTRTSYAAVFKMTNSLVCSVSQVGHKEQQATPFILTFPLRRVTELLIDDKLAYEKIPALLTSRSLILSVIDEKGIRTKIGFVLKDPDERDAFYASLSIMTIVANSRPRR